MLGQAAFDTLKVASMILWITIGAKAFVAIFTGTGGADFLLEQISALDANRYVILVVMMLTLVFLGMFLDEIGIILLCVPVFLPIIKYLGFEPLWFGVVFLVSAQMAYITPPFGYTLFYLKGVVPPSISMATIYRAIVPFFILQILGLIICIVWPELVLWLPRQMAGS
jgi:TRAP-type mannitol/chloroaromatic compound transport system permease large subunit